MKFALIIAASLSAASAAAQDVSMDVLLQQTGGCLLMSDFCNYQNTSYARQFSQASRHPELVSESVLLNAAVSVNLSYGLGCQKVSGGEIGSAILRTENRWFALYRQADDRSVCYLKDLGSRN